MRGRFHERIGPVTELGRPDARDLRPRWQRLGEPIFAATLLIETTKRMIDFEPLRYAPTCEPDIALLDRTARKRIAEQACTLEVERKQKYARGSAIEPVDGMNGATYRRDQQIDGRPFIAPPSAMDDQTARLCHGDEGVVEVEDLEFIRRKGPRRSSPAWRGARIPDLPPGLDRTSRGGARR